MKLAAEIESPDYSRAFVLAAAGAAVAISISMLALWLIGTDASRAFAANSMKFNSALSFLFAALTLHLHSLHSAEGNGSPNMSRDLILARGLTFFILALSGATLCEYLFRVNLGIDQWAVRDVITPESERYPGRMAPNTASGIFIIGLSLLTLDPKLKWMRISQALALAAATIGFFALVGYAYRATSLFTTANFIRMSPYSAATLVILSIGLLLHCSRLGLVRVLMSRTVSGRYARLTTLAALSIPLAIGWVCETLETRGYLDAQTAAALSSLLTGLALLTLVWLSTDSIARSEDDLRRNEREFRAIFELVPIGATQTDPESGRLVRVNEKFCQITGYSADELSRISVRELTHPDDREEDWRKYCEMVRGNEKEYRNEKRYVRKDGSIVWVEAASRPIRDAKGNALRTIGIVKDITDRKLAEAERERARAQIEAVFHSVNDGIVVFDSVGNVSMVNEAEAKMVGYASAEAMKVDLAHFADVFELSNPITGELVPLEEWPVSRVMRGEHLMNVELAGRRRDTNQSWIFSFSGSPVLDEDGKQMLSVVITRDVTEMKRAERSLLESKEAAEKANLAKSQFLANMSHEIRTPIGAIAGFIDLLKSKETSEAETKDYLSIIDRNSNHLLRLIDDILDLSKIEAGKIAIEKADFSLVEHLTEFEASMKFLASEKGISFDLKVSTPIPERVVSDPVRLRQILVNAVGNAIKFTEHGGVKVEASYADKFIRFTVSDTGIGIAPDAVGRLFQPFVQADPSMSRRFGGTGLGLLLTRRLCQAFGGDFKLIDTKPGRGSVFMATLNLEPAADSPMVSFSGKGLRSSDSSSHHEDHALVHRRILVVDDSPDNRMLISTYLKKAGAEVYFAADGAEGVNRAFELLPDAVLMDIQMPNLDGHEATKKLRADGYTKPIIALTAHAMREERDRCLASGCTDYLSKPIKKDLLIATLSHYMPALAEA